VAFTLFQPNIPYDDGYDQPKTIMIDMMQMCWSENPAARPSFSQISAKITSLF